MLANEYIYRGLRRCGKIRAGTGPNPETLSDGLGDLNSMLSQLSTRGAMIYTIQADRYTLFQPAPAGGFYLIGPTAMNGVDGFNATRPEGPGPGNGIKNANIVMTNVTPEVFLPVYLMNDDQFADLRVRHVLTTISIAMYNDGSFPNSRLYFYGIPNQANDLELFTRKQFSSFAALSTDIDLPPGYDDAFQWTLAERFCVLFHNENTAAVEPGIKEQARKARAAVASLNSGPPLLMNDAAFQSGRGVRSHFNYLTGNLS